MMTVITIIIVLSVLVLVHELGHFLAARMVGVRVEEFSIGMFISIFSWKRGETRYSIKAIPIGGFVRLTGEDGSQNDDPQSFSSKSRLQRTFILSAGVIMNFILAVVLFAFINLVGVPEWGGQVMIQEVISETPAAEAGLQSEDIIRKINHQNVQSSESLQSIIAENVGHEVTLTIERGDETIEYQVLARENPPEGQGSMGISMGVYPTIVSTQKYSIFPAVVEAIKLTGTMSYEMVVGVGMIFKDLFTHGSVPEGVAGPVGIGRIMNELLNFGIIPVIQFAAMFSINLAILNILPFPALDGGRIFFVLIESIRGKKVSVQVEGWFHATGFVLLLILLVLITYRDIVRLF